MGQEELRLLSLAPTELRVLLAMRVLADPDGVTVEAGMDDIGDYTGYGRTTISKAVASLELAGLIQVTRTKRNYGKLYFNKYKLLPCSPVRTSTADTSSNDNLTTVTTKELNTSYLISAEAQKDEDGVVNKWKDDDGVGGFGLLDSDKPASSDVKKTPKTRHSRPKAEWTSSDVASEFAYQLYQRVRGVPGLINISKLAPVLGKYRKDYGTTALYELQVLDKLLGDNRLLAEVKKAPHNAWKLFLRMLATEGGSATIEAPTEDIVEQLVASDGRKFDNSVPGRLALDRYEKKLKGE
jgi:predicted transcriptional regulator